MAIDKQPAVSYIRTQRPEGTVGMHYFINFKNYSSANINLYSNLTLLIGKNGSGKSNLIEGVELLAALAEGKPLHEMVDRGPFQGPGIVRGGIHNCVKFGEKFFSLGFDGRINFLGKSERFDYRITVSVDPFPRIVYEYLHVGRRKIFVAEGESSDGMLNVTFDNFARGGIKPRKNLYGDKSVISRYAELTDSNEAGDPEKKLKAIKVVGIICRYMQSSFIFDPNPKLMRDYVRSGQNKLLKDASNLSAVLQGLDWDMRMPDILNPNRPKPDNAEPYAIERILNVVRQIPEEPFLKFDFVTTQQMDVLFGIVVDDKTIDARLMSDGTLRIIAVIAALESIDSGSRVVIEEFDNGLHPSRAEILINAIMEIVTRRKLNVLISTHNPASLNSLDAEWLKDVHICHWDNTVKSSTLTRLLDIPKVDSLLESKANLGDLITKSIFEKHLQPRFEEEKKAKAMEWLSRLGG